MADKFQAWPENVKGRFYVDRTCVACDACCATAPKNFIMHDNGHSVLSKQPENAAEEAEIREAIEGCPVSAIGDDRESAQNDQQSAR